MKIKKILPFIIIFLLLLLIKNNIISIFNSLNNTNTTGNLTHQLEEKKRENKYLKERLSYVKSDQFVQEQAQEKLGLLKPGEYFVIAPTATPVSSDTVSFDDRPNWKKWWDLFF